jgi:6-phosphogluconate dehydrogenase (decarboxylating)
MLFARRFSDIILDIDLSNYITEWRVVAVLGGVVDELIDIHVVDVGDLAQITGATSRSVSRWTAAKAMPRREAEDRLLELRAVVD